MVFRCGHLGFDEVCLRNSGSLTYKYALVSEFRLFTIEHVAYEKLHHKLKFVIIIVDVVLRCQQENAIIRKTYF